MQERVKKPKLTVKLHEKMRIAGKLVDGEERIEVRNPYTGAVVATVAAASPGQVAEAFRSATPTSRSSLATTAKKS
jgi:acyl-CoA reductase-like NAD-dependent aldehyde dehydrogenase